MYNEMNNNKVDSLEKLKQINMSLDNMNDINKNNLKRVSNNKINFKDNFKNPLDINNNKPTYSVTSTFNDINKNIDEVNNFFIKNNYPRPNASLNELVNINKGIDSIYNNMQSMKSSNKINSKVLYSLSHSSQTFDDY